MRGFFYTFGMLVLACGVTMNTKTGLGVSPIISVPYSIAQIWDMNLGNLTFCVYTVFVLGQALLAGKMTLNFVLQLPLSLVFSRFLNVFDRLLPQSGPALWEQLLMLACAIGLTGLGIVLTVRTKLIPNPGDGIVHELSKVIHKSLGFSKNLFDLLNLCISCTIGILGAGCLVGIGAGTVCTMLFTGRAVALFSWLLAEPVLRLSGLSEERGAF